MIKFVPWLMAFMGFMDLGCFWLASSLDPACIDAAITVIAEYTKRLCISFAWLLLEIREHYFHLMSKLDRTTLILDYF